MYEQEIEAEKQAEHQNFCEECKHWDEIWMCAVCGMLVCADCIPEHGCE